jgi:hypothetical protein
VSFLVALVALLFLCGGFANAQQPAKARVTLLTKPFAERFEGRSEVKVSGSLLVGAHLGDLSGKFDPGLLAVSLFRAPAHGKLCLSVATRDGRYISENLYDASVSGPALTEFDFSTSYRENLSKYLNSNIATLIRDSDGCNSPDFGTIYPSSFATRSRSRTLTIAVNAPAQRTTARILKGKQTIAEGVCGGDRATVSIAFSTVCSFDLAGQTQSGIYTLQLNVRERFETARKDMAIALELAPRSR